MPITITIPNISNTYKEYLEKVKKQLTECQRQFLIDYKKSNSPRLILAMKLSNETLKEEKERKPFVFR